MHIAEEVRTKTNHLRGLFGQHELREMLLAYADLLEKCEVEQRELSFAQEQIKELLQVLADEGRNIPHRYVEVDGICHRLLGTSSISAFERLERRKDTQIAALQAENAELSINPDIAEYAKLREQLAALREALERILISGNDALSINSTAKEMALVAHAALAATRKEEGNG